MALTPRSDDPNRAALLKEMKEKHASGKVGQDMLKADWNADAPPSKPDAKTVEKAVEKPAEK